MDTGDLLLHSIYLKALEEASPLNIKLYYIEVFKDEKLVGIAVAQRVRLYLKDMFRKRQVNCFKEFFRDSISKMLKGNILVVGNITHTGQHAMFCNAQEITISDFYSEILKACTSLKSSIKSETGDKIRAIMFKDFFMDDKMVKKSNLEQLRFHKFRVQPNMIMNIKPHWKDNQGYLLDMNKKYRYRYKRAKKKLNSIISKEMDLNDISLNSKRLYRLYMNVSNNAKFNTFILPENHFYTYKFHLKDNFKVIGYYFKEELVGFFTLICNNKHLETYFLGYDEEQQYPNQLYLNMLYDMAKFGIENNFKEIVYARTAMEIKSSVGAKPEPMVIYLKHTNSILNSILKSVFKLMNPSKDWEERHPFKS